MQFEPDVPEVRKAYNQLAREQLKCKLLADIATDVRICQLEGWEYREYLLELQMLINHFIN